MVLDEITYLTANPPLRTTLESVIQTEPGCRSSREVTVDGDGCDVARHRVIEPDHRASTASTRIYNNGCLKQCCQIIYPNVNSCYILN